MKILPCKRKSNVDIGWKSEVDPGAFATVHIHRMFLDNNDKIQRVELSLTMRPDCPPVKVCEEPYKYRPKQGGRGNKVLVRFNDTISIGESIEIIIMGSGKNSPSRYTKLGFKAPEDVYIHRQREEDPTRDS